jgi:hypothetical protein
MSFFILIVLVGYIVLSYLAVRWVWMKKKSYMLTAFAVVSFILLATWDNIIGNIMFYRLCKEQGGERIYKTVENVEGYMTDDPNGCDGICMKELLEKRYKFVEVNAVRPRKDDLTTEPGLHRFYLDRKGSPECKLYEEYYAEREKHKDTFLKQYSYEYCIASKKVDEMKSRYIYIDYSIDRNYLPAWNISKTESAVKDIKTGELLGSVKYFSYYGGWIISYMTNGVGSSKECPEGDIRSKMHRSLLYEVLRPEQ